MTFSGGVTYASSNIPVATKADSVSESTETVILELHDPQVPQLGGYVTHNGAWVHVRTLLPPSIKYRGEIYDSSICSNSRVASALCD